jgi:hypothetical protein
MQSHHILILINPRHYETTLIRVKLLIDRPITRRVTRDPLHSIWHCLSTSSYNRTWPPPPSTAAVLPPLCRTMPPLPRSAAAGLAHGWGKPGRHASPTRRYTSTQAGSTAQPPNWGCCRRQRERNQSLRPHEPPPATPNRRLAASGRRRRP